MAKLTRMDEETTAGEAFRAVFRGHPNFMTPHWMAYRTTEKHFIEVSQGTGISGVTIYGVTVLDRSDIHDYQKRKALSRCLHSLREVDDYIRTLEGK